MIDIEQQVWGMTSVGDPVILYTMTNSRGEWVKLTNFGAAVVGVGVCGSASTDTSGATSEHAFGHTIEDVVLGYDSWASYQDDQSMMGKSVGRCANRIARGRFELDGTAYQLPINLRPHHIHGGNGGFHNVVWQSRVEGDRVVFSYVSPAGEGGYPGEVGVECVYDWDDESALEITYFGASDSRTILNLTNHLYFNLSGVGGAESSSSSSSSSSFGQDTVLEHELLVVADGYLVCDGSGVPTGEISMFDDCASTFVSASVSVDCDFREMRVINSVGQDAADFQGFDVCFDVRNANLSSAWRDSCVAVLEHRGAGRRVEVYTTQPGLQLYTGNYLQGVPRGKGGVEYCDFAGVALECQGFPDAVNHPEFPSVEIDKDQVYEQHTVYKFSVIGG